MSGCKGWIGRWLSVLVLCVWMGGPAMAQESKGPEEKTAFQLQQFRPSGDPNGGFQSFSGKTLGHLVPSISLMFHYAFDSLFLVSNKTGRELSVMTHQMGADLIAGIGLFSFLEIDLVLPLTLRQEGALPELGALDTASARSLSGTALGDIQLRIKVQILNQDSHGIDFGMYPYIGIPSGNPNNFNGEGALSAGGALLLSRGIALGPRTLRFNVNLGFRYLPKTTFLTLAVGNEIFYNLGASLDVVPNRFALLLDLGGGIGYETPEGQEQASVRDQSPMGAYLGGRIWATPTFAINFGVGIGLMGGYGSPRFRAFLGITWSPASSKATRTDSDKDGIKDAYDRCPNKPGPKENKGCPWPDSDADGVPDRRDNCPKQAGAISNQGCPVKDSDGDGIPDHEDNCPKRKGEKSNGGCPRPQPRPVRRAPVRRVAVAPVRRRSTAPRRSGWKASDWDNDGIPNRRDRCPDIYGSRRRRGCPRRVYVRLRLRKKRIYMRRAVVFYRGTRMTKRSRYILRQLASMLKSRPTMKIRIVAITLSRSRRRWVKRLSNKRARAIRSYLSKYGVSKKRVKYKGFRRRRRRYRRAKTIFRFYVLRR